MVPERYGGCGETIPGSLATAKIKWLKNFKVQIVRVIFFIAIAIVEVLKRVRNRRKNNPNHKSDSLCVVGINQTSQLSRFDRVTQDLIV